MARRCGTEGRASQQRTRRACVAQLGSGGRRRRRKRTRNMSFMPVTLEVSKLSGWLKASAFCRVRNRASDRGTTRVARRCGTEGRANQQRTRRACVAQELGSGGRRRRRKRTANMSRMSVTLEVSKLSGWLKATAYCRVQRGHSTEGNACGMWHTEGMKGESAQRTRRVCVTQLGSGGRRGAGGSAQRTLGRKTEGRRVWHGDVWHRRGRANQQRTRRACVWPSSGVRAEGAGGSAPGTCRSCL